MKLRRWLAAFAALLLFVPPNSLHPQERPAQKISPIRRPPGYAELKNQADASRRAAERAPAPLAPLEQPVTSAATIGTTSFAGMNFEDSLPNDPVRGFVPPDTHAATGPDRIAETINTSLKIYSRTDGTPITPNAIDLNNFFGVPSNHVLTDPVVHYDESLERFFIGVIDFGTGDPPTSSNLLYAVSNDSSPSGTASFTKYTIPVHHKAKFFSCGTVEADFTRAGWNADAHVFAFNMFNFGTNCFDGVRIVVIDKSSIGGTLAFK